jgi:hypothetical protein
VLAVFIVAPARRDGQAPTGVAEFDLVGFVFPIFVVSVGRVHRGATTPRRAGS